MQKGRENSDYKPCSRLVPYLKGLNVSWLRSRSDFVSSTQRAPLIRILLFGMSKPAKGFVVRGGVEPPADFQVRCEGSKHLKAVVIRYLEVEIRN